MGLLSLGGYFTVNANTAICLSVLGLAANARYGLSIQLVGVISGMAVGLDPGQMADDRPAARPA